jgi:ferredoxin
MVNCPVCKMHVDYKFLRSDNPRDEPGHDLGKWVHCENVSEKHVYLRNQDMKDTCPYCDSKTFAEMKNGEKVKCMHSTETGAMCQARSYSWIEEGPPCFMNHIAKMRLEPTSSSTN